MPNQIRWVRHRATVLLLTIVVLSSLSASIAGSSAQGRYPRAPEWEVSEWIGGNPGTVASNRGKVILIDFFQMWCPGCNRFSLPLFERWQEKYGSRDDVQIVSIHTVFEGHSSQAPHKLKRFVDRERFEHPVGIDAYSPQDDETPITMKRFRTRGTPHVVIIDKQGRVRLSRFGRFETAPVEQMIDHLLAESILESSASD